MIKKKFFVVLVFVFLAIFPFGQSIVYANSGEEVILGGYSAGFSLYSKGACVVGVCDVVTENGLISPCKESQIEVGDIILSINGNETNSSFDIERFTKNGDLHVLLIERNGENLLKNIYPAKDLNGKFRLGVFVRDTVNGIGTITYIKDNKFASLGHPVLDEGGKILKIKGGALMDCSITGCVKGEKGKPGELRGAILKKKEIGTIESNRENGVYGCLDMNKINFENVKKIKIGKAKIGDAHIYTTVCGNTPKKYSISIIKVDDYKNNSKNMVIKILDEELINCTGGIVQGMSGSPIVQDGKLVGAVTHVFINDPTRGFGLSIQNMSNV